MRRADWSDPVLIEWRFHGGPEVVRSAGFVVDETDEAAFVAATERTDPLHATLIAKPWIVRRRRLMAEGDVP